MPSHIRNTMNHIHAKPNEQQSKPGMLKTVSDTVKDMFKPSKQALNMKTLFIILVILIGLYFYLKQNNQLPTWLGGKPVNQHLQYFFF